ncbi:MAG: metallophosphoesterase [Candidatus Nitrospinota bacterium M3_3B_026]
MRLGIISDTHDRVPAIEAAVEMFNETGVEAVLHLGDFVAPFALLPFRDLKAPFYAVYGNNDGEKAGLEKIFEDNGWSLRDRPWILELKGKRIAMLHEPGPLDRFTREGGMDLIAFGHTHEPLAERRGGALVVNPGEGCGWLYGAPTAAVADLASGECEIRRLKIEPRPASPVS